MAKLNKPVFKRVIAVTVGFIIFMLITNLWVKEPSILKVVVAALVSGVIVGMVFYFIHSWQDRRIEKKKVGLKG